MERMNSSFLATLLAVLGDQPEIENLPDNQLIASDHEGERLDKVATRPIFRKIARLQTLCFRAHEDARMPELDATKEIAATTGGSTAEIMANALGIQEDSTRRIMMLERLIVELVREAVPAEIERLDVEYVAHVDAVIMRRPIRRQRFLD
jgi:hypothetical protein